MLRKLHHDDGQSGALTIETRGYASAGNPAVQVVHGRVQGMTLQKRRKTASRPGGPRVQAFLTKPCFL